MKHEFIEDTDIDISDFDDITKVEVCKYCDVQMWHWIRVSPGKVEHFKYMLLKGTQYFNLNEECKDPYNLRKLTTTQLTLF